MQSCVACLRDSLHAFLDRHFFEQGDEVHHGFGGADDVYDPGGVVADRAYPGQAGDFGGDVEETSDAAGGRGVEHYGVVDVRAGTVVPGTLRGAAAHCFGDFAGQEDVAGAGRDRGGEVDDAEAAECTADPAQAVEHLQVFQERCLSVDGERVDRAAVVGGGDFAFRIGQRVEAEERGDAVPFFNFHQQHFAAFRGQG